MALRVFPSVLIYGHDDWHGEQVTGDERQVRQVREGEREGRRTGDGEEEEEGKEMEREVEGKG